MSNKVRVTYREVDAGEIVRLLGTGAERRPITVGQAKADLSSMAEAAAETIKVQMEAKADRFIWRKELPYGSEEELLQHSDRMTDFLILDLVDHFRSYEWGKLPGHEGARYMTSIRGSGLVRKRMSGHVSTSFAEAMCPWVFEGVGIASAGDFVRLAGLAPTTWGRVVPDFVFLRDARDVPCEVKHYSQGIRWDAVATAITQVTAAMSVIRSSEGYIFLALNSAASEARYHTEIVRLVL
jgi:hypothetical protein